MNYLIRNAQAEDLPEILAIYEQARTFMAKNGNPTQWGSTEPPKEKLIDDIGNQYLYVLTEGNSIHGVFYFYVGEDPTYGVIEEGCWNSALPYGTIHRIASDGSGGILRAAVQFALQRSPYLRIDTHEDNRIMQSALNRVGFRRCGVIHLENGDPRIAYDYLK